MIWLKLVIIWYIIGVIAISTIIISQYIISRSFKEEIGISNFNLILFIIIVPFGGPLALGLVIYSLLRNNMEFLKEIHNIMKSWKMNVFKTKCIIIDFNLPLKFRRLKFDKHLKYHLFLFTIILLDRGITEVIYNAKNMKEIKPEEFIRLYNAIFNRRINVVDATDEVNNLLLKNKTTL